MAVRYCRDRGLARARVQGQARARTAGEDLDRAHRRGPGPAGHRDRDRGRNHHVRAGPVPGRRAWPDVVTNSLRVANLFGGNRRRGRHRGADRRMRTRIGRARRAGGGPDDRVAALRHAVPRLYRARPRGGPVHAEPRPRPRPTGRADQPGPPGGRARRPLQVGRGQPGLVRPRREGQRAGHRRACSRRRGTRRSPGGSARSSVRSLPGAPPPARAPEGGASADATPGACCRQLEP